MTTDKKVIDHDYTDNIICPYCGAEYTDSWELSDNSGTEECSNCGKNFNFERIITVEYCTEKIPLQSTEVPQ